MSREADGWYVTISCAEVAVKPLPLTGEDTGIDLGWESFATLADGEPIANLRLVRRVAKRHLRQAQRRVSRQVKGSERRKRAVHLLAKAHQRVRRTRADFHHKTALTLVRQDATSAHEDVQTAHLLRNHQLATSIADGGWSAFLRILSCKAAAAGKAVVAVPPAYTSRVCAGCRVLVQKGLSVGWQLCPDCGTSLHRNQNAARNSLRWGTERRAAGQSVQARTWAAGPSVA
jgi:putative transposase